MSVSAGLPRPFLVGSLGLVAAALGILAGIDPTLALAVAFGAVFVLVVVADLSAGVALFALLAFLDSLPNTDESAISFAKAAGLLLAISWFAAMTTRSERRRDLFTEQPGLAYLVVLFLAWSVLSQLWAESSSDALDATFRYGLSLALLPIVFTALREKKHVVWVLAAYVGGATFAAAYGIVAQPEVSDDLQRLSGTIGDPNQLAAVLAAGVVIAAGLAGAARAYSPARLLALMAGGSCLIAALATLSRGGIVALLVGFLAALILGGRWRKHVAVLGVVAAMSAACFFALFAPPGATERILAADGGTGRTDIWTIGWRMVEDEPLTGVGSGNFPVASVNYLIEPGTIERDEFILDTPKVAHNVYLEIWAEMGIVGLALFLALAGTSLGCAMRAAGVFRRAGDSQMELLARAAAIAVVVILAADFFISDQFSKQLWLLMGLGPGLLAIARDESTDSRRRTV